jgi:poly-gamma-glutamate synthesis protein (capsule biosynthesis protein)
MQVRSGGMEREFPGQGTGTLENIIKINAVGDVFLGDYTITLGFGVGSSVERYGVEHNFANVKCLLRDADIVFGNLETVTSGIGRNEKDMKTVICRGGHEGVDVLKSAGFNVLNIANNHMLQHGVEAFHDTIGRLERNGIAVVGVRDGGAYLCKPLVVNVRNRSIGILAYSFVREAYFDGDVLYAPGDKDGILKDIEGLRTSVDHVIVSCHWGIEFVDTPSPNMRRLAREMVDAGASVILGHHPHVLQGIERYKDRLIFYSLGNFLFDFVWSRATRESLVASISISGKSMDYTLHPVSISGKYQVNMMNQEETACLKDYVKRLSSRIEDEKIFDLEDMNYEYYVRAYKAELLNQARKSIYLMKNSYRLDGRFIKYFLGKLRNLAFPG